MFSVRITLKIGKN